VPDWTAFWAVATLVLLSMLGLARATSGAFDGPDAEPGVADPEPGVAHPEGPDPPRDTGEQAAAQPTDSQSGIDAPSTAEQSPAETARDQRQLTDLPPLVLLLNVVVTHGGLGLLVLGAAGLTGVPLVALGIGPTSASTGILAVAGGLVLGGLLAGANAAMAATLEQLGIEHSEALRAAMAPRTTGGWILLLGAILPLVAVFEELFFRAVLIGAAAAATGLSPWLFVVPSTVAFAAGHGLQGRGGLLVTGVLGIVLGAAFVLTNSLLLVVLAHYVINAVEFLARELVGVTPEAFLENR